MNQVGYLELKIKYLNLKISWVKQNLSRLI